MCQHSYYYQGYRSYGDNIPGFAQGAYYPGDEPGDRCLLTDDYCNPDTCPEKAGERPEQNSGEHHVENSSGL